MKRAALGLLALLAGAPAATARIVLIETPDGPVYTYVPEPAGNALPSLSSRRQPWLPLIDECAQRHGVDARLVEAIVACESGFDPQAVSSAGAEGLMQLMPQTQGEYGCEDAFDATLNVDAGTRLLSDLLRSFGGDWRLATAAYNAGAGAVRRAGGIPDYPETMHYVRKVDHYLGLLGADMPSAHDGVTWSGEPAAARGAEPIVVAEAEPPPPPEPPKPRGPKPVITRDERGQTLFTNTSLSRKP